MKKIHLLLVGFFLLCTSIVAYAQQTISGGTFNGAQVVPSVTSAGKGPVDAVYDSGSRTLAVRIDFEGLSGSVTSAGLYSGAAGTNGALQIDLTALGFPAGASFGSFSRFLPTLSATQGVDLAAGKLYVLLKTAAFPNGEVRAQLNYNTTPSPDVTKSDIIIGTLSPNIGATGKGTLDGLLDNSSFIYSFRIDWAGLNSPVTGASFNVGSANGIGGTLYDLVALGFPTGTLEGNYRKSIQLTPAQAADLKGGKFYLILKTAASPNGALTSSLVSNKTDATTQQTDKIKNEITGAQQVPANASTGNGVLDGLYERDKRLFSFRIDFNKLGGNVTAAHFHVGSNGVNGPVALDLVSLGFPTGVKDGTFIKSIVLTEEQGAALIAGKYYLNIHTDLFPNGELRSQLNYKAAAPIPVTSPTGKASGTFSGAQQNPAVNTAATGKMEGIFDTYSRGFAFRIDFSGLSSPVTAAHFHGGAAGTNGAVTLDLVPLGFPTGVTNGSFVKFLHLTPAQAEDLKSGKMYVNIHTAKNPGGEIRAQVAYVTADISPAPAPNKVNKIAGGFTGAQEVPAVATKATGTIDGIFDPFSRVLAFRIDFAGLNSTVTAAHFHSGAAGTNGSVTLDLVPQGFPKGVTSGSFVKVITLTVAQAADLVAGKLYANIHTISSPNGEIRAQINYNPASAVGRKGNTESVTIAEKLNISEKVALYPNPAREGVTINTSDFAGEAVRIVLYNAAGQIMKVEAINAMNASHRLALNGLDKGLYILQMTSETSKATQKLIVE